MIDQKDAIIQALQETIQDLMAQNISLRMRFNQKATAEAAEAANRIPRPNIRPVKPNGPDKTADKTTSQ